MKKGVFHKKGTQKRYVKWVSTSGVLGTKWLELIQLTQWHWFGSKAQRPLETECCCNESLWSITVPNTSLKIYKNKKRNQKKKRRERFW